MMIALQYDPYKNFMTSTTPVGLYARQKWLGQEGDNDWQAAFDKTVALLLKDQLQDGSWGNSFIQTVHRLFGLHLTVRHPTDNIMKALDWLLNQIEHTDDNKDLIVTDLRGLPFVPGDPNFLYAGMALFLAACFGRENAPEVITRYQKLSQQILENSGFLDNYGNINNILRAFVVYPSYAQNAATMFMVKYLSKIQDNSGMWTNSVPFYQTLNALAHLNLPLADRQLEKPFLLLAQTQNSDGTWGDTEKEWNTFLVVHAIRNKKMLK
jgi:hypothetical protein